MLDMSYDQEKEFIHFDSIDECERFKKWYTGSIGQTCCYGLGCHLHNVPDYKQVEIIRTRFLSSQGVSPTVVS